MNLVSEGNDMTANRGVVYTGPGKVEVQSIAYPELKTPQGRKIEHGVILKPVTTNICGSDQHMVRGRTAAPTGMVLGHEITSEVIECGHDVEFIKTGDLVSVPFNVACGRCRNCKERHTDVCLNVNPSRAGGAYGYVDLGGWVGGQAEYVMVPYADWNLLKFPDKAQALDKILGVPEVDCAVDCVGFEAKGHGGVDEPAVVLNQLMEATRAAGAIGIPGLYVTEDPGAKDEAAKRGNLTMRLGLGWAKSHSFTTGQTPVMKYNHGLMMAILHDRIKIAKAVNVEVISLEKAPEAYKAFDAGIPKKFVIDPHHTLDIHKRGSGRNTFHQ